MPIKRRRLLRGPIKSHNCNRRYGYMICHPSASPATTKVIFYSIISFTSARPGRNRTDRGHPRPQQLQRECVAGPDGAGWLHKLRRHPRSKLLQGERAARSKIREALHHLPHSLGHCPHLLELQGELDNWSRQRRVPVVLCPGMWSMPLPASGSVQLAQTEEGNSINHTMFMEVVQLSHHEFKGDHAAYPGGGGGLHQPCCTFHAHKLFTPPSSQRRWRNEPTNCWKSHGQPKKKATLKREVLDCISSGIIFLGINPWSQDKIQADFHQCQKKLWPKKWCFFVEIIFVRTKGKKQE